MKSVPLLSFVLAIALTGCARNELPASTNAEPAAPALVYAKGRIDIEGGLIRLAASREGIVKSVSVEEGRRVRAGEILATIDDQSTRLASAVAAAELAQSRAVLPALLVRLAAAEREANRLASLPVDASVGVELDAARDQIALLQAERVVAEAAVTTAEARLRVSDYELEQRIVRAPLDGWIVKRYARPGDGISTLNVTPLFLFSPDAARIVRSDLDERFVDRVRPELAAEVVIEADETRVFPGRILRVGQVFGTKAPTGEPGERLDQRVVECVVSVEDQSLRIGQRVLVRLKP